MVKIKFFAILKEIVGEGEVMVPVEDGATLEQLLDQLEQIYPRLLEARKQGRFLISVNQEFVAHQYVMRHGDEVALLPPFSGGCADERKIC